MQLVIGRIGRAHGIQGQVGVEVRTDDPDGRFAAGNVIATDPPERGPLTMVGSRWHSGRLLVRFAGTDDRTAAEALRGTVLVIDVDEADRATEPDEYYDHHLVGLRALTPAGVEVGTVTEVLHLPAQDVSGDHRASTGSRFSCRSSPNSSRSSTSTLARSSSSRCPGLLDPDAIDAD